MDRLKVAVSNDPLRNIRERNLGDKEKLGEARQIMK